MSADRSLEIWGGIECTVARIGDRYRSQIDETGHRDRPEDLDRIAALGIRTLRYPVLWEDVAPVLPGRSRWAWHDARLGRLRELGIDPIVGLLHHGSGPSYTNLLDPGFPARFTRHAERVARRYPWVTRYTPVNEPLTTARFSCLYGHWYPHRTGYRDFLAALVSQCVATIDAMAAIRRVNPEAELVQTEDCGRIFSTPRLAYQAEHENERRWLTFDLLFGRVDRHHPWWRICLDHGVVEADLCRLRDAGIRPGLVGINHYLTSDRFLDETLGLYPGHLVGGNGREAYADVEAVRVDLPAEALGPAARLRETWARYRAPIAITEAHHGCTRDEQLRWLMEAWRAAGEVRREGADIRAVTAWSLFGTIDWNSLLTREAGIYEPGAFDVRGPEPRRTAIADAVSSLAARGSFDHPALDGPPWWRRPARLHRPERAAAESWTASRRLLIRGRAGAAERALAVAADARGLALFGDEAGEAPLRSVLAAIGRGEIWAVVDRFDPDGGERDLADRRRLRDAAAKAGIPYLLISSAAVFDGSLGRPAREADAPSPRDRAAEAILAAERAVSLARAPAWIVRAGLLFGPGETDDLLAALDAHPTDDATQLSLTYLPDLAHVVLDGLVDGETGLRHLVSGTLSRAALRQRLASGPRLVAMASPGDQDPAQNPWVGTIATALGSLMPSLEHALDRHLAEPCDPVGEPAEARPLAAA